MIFYFFSKSSSNQATLCMILASSSNEKYNYKRITLKLKAEDKAKTSRSKNLENPQVTKERGGGN